MASVVSMQFVCFKNLSNDSLYVYEGKFSEDALHVHTQQTINEFNVTSKTTTINQTTNRNITDN